MTKHKVVLLNKFELFENSTVACESLNLGGREQEIETCCIYFADNTTSEVEPEFRMADGEVLHWVYADDLEKLFDK